jgi:hypothetical protein
MVDAWRAAASVRRISRRTRPDRIPGSLEGAFVLARVSRNGVQLGQSVRTSNSWKRRARVLNTVYCYYYVLYLLWVLVRQLAEHMVPS